MSTLNEVYEMHESEMENSVYLAVRSKVCYNCNEVSSISLLDPESSQSFPLSLQ